MFYKYRSEMLQIKIDVQIALVEKLEKAEVAYGISYYTDQLHTEFCRLVKMQSKHKWLIDKLAEGMSNV